MMSENLKKRLISILLVIIIFLIFSFKPILVLTLLIVGNLTIIEFSSIIKNTKKNFLKFVFNLLFITYILFFTFILYFQIFYLKLIFIHSYFVVLLPNIACYIFGNIFKGPKLTSNQKKQYRQQVWCYFVFLYLQLFLNFILSTTQ